MARDRNEIKKGLPELEAMLIDFLFDCGVGAKHINGKKVLEYAPKIQELCDRLTNRRKKVLGQLSETPNDLEEAAEKFARFYDQGTCDGIAQDCFKAGAKWQKEQDDKELSDLLTIAHLQGAEQMKEQIMKDAVEADVNTYKDPVLSCGWAEFVVDMPSSETDKFGDKVRIIIVKEDGK